MTLFKAHQEWSREAWAGSTLSSSGFRFRSGWGERADWKLYTKHPVIGYWI